MNQTSSHSWPFIILARNPNPVGSDPPLFLLVDDPLPLELAVYVPPPPNVVIPPPDFLSYAIGTLLACSTISSPQQLLYHLDPPMEKSLFPSLTEVPSSLAQQERI